MLTKREWAMILISLEVVLSMMTATEVIISPMPLDVAIFVALVVITILDLVMFVRKDIITDGRW